MFAPTYTYEQLYAVYHRGFHPTRHLIEDLLGTLAEWEQILDTSRRRAVEGLQARSRKLEAQLARSKAESARREHEAYVLRRRVQELQQELARRDDQARRDAAVAAAAAGDIRGAAAAMAAVRRDSHNSDLRPSLDPPGARARNAVSFRERGVTSATRCERALRILRARIECRLNERARVTGFDQPA